MKSEAQRQQESQTAEKTAAGKPAEGATQAAAGEAETPPAEAKVEGAAKPAAETDADDVLSNPTSQLDEKTRAGIEKRIGKEVAKRQDLDRQLQDLQEKHAEAMRQLEEARKPKEPVKPLPNGQIPLSNIDDVQGLVQLNEQAKQAIRWADRLLGRQFGDSIEVDGQTFTREQIETVKWNAIEAKEDHIPARMAFLQGRQQAQQQAFERYPFLKDRSTPEYQQAQEAYRTYPWLRNLPNSDEIIGRQIMGLKYEGILAAQAAEKSGKPKAPKTPPKPSGDQTEVSSDASATRVPVTTANKQAMQAANERLRAKGAVTASTYAAHLAQKEALKQTR